MPALSPLLAVVISTVAQENAFAPEWAISTRSIRSDSDFLSWGLSITRELAAALESSLRIVGAQIEIDKGDGELVPLLQTEIEEAIEMQASREGYGARTLSFAIQVPPSQSPFYSAWSRGPHRVRLTGYLGTPGVMQPRRMFDGYTTQCSWEAYPSVLRVQCQDVSVLLASEKLAYNLEPGSLRTRKDVFREIMTPYLDLYGIEFGRLDFGSNDGGVLFKGISEGGTVGLLEWIVAYLTPIGRRLDWDGGACNVEPSYASGPPARTFRANDISSLSVQLPALTDTTAVVMTSTVFAYIGPTGQRTEIEIKLTRGLFTPESAVSLQDHTSGTITPLALTVDPAIQEISRVVTTRTYDAGTLVLVDVDEWGWYSARACPKRQDADGTIGYNDQFDVYFYADGECRLESQQQYQRVRRSDAYKEWAEDGVTIAADSFRLAQFSANIVPIGYVDDVGAEIPVPVFLRDDGVAWAEGHESFEYPHAFIDQITLPEIGPLTLFGGRRAADNNGFGDTLRRTVYEADADGRIAKSTTTLTVSGFFYAAVEPPVAPFSTVSALIYGPASSKVYARSDRIYAVHQVAPQVVTTYSAIDETSHKETVTVTPGIEYVNLDPLRRPTPPSSGERIVAGAVPVMERLTSGQTAQPASATVIDSVRSGLLGKVLPDYQQNDFCQTVDELLTCALELQREKVPNLELESLVDWTVTPGKAVAVLLPEAIPADEVMTAWGVDWSIDGRTGENHQRLSARWLPKELR